MGLYDVVANVNMIKERARVEKIYYVGYQQGSTQMFYALAQLEELEKSLLTVVGLSPCWFLKNFGEEFYRENEFAYRDLGIFAYFGPTWSDDKFKICTELS